MRGMTEDQRRALLVAFQARADVAAAMGLPATARSWLDRYANLAKADPAVIPYVDRDGDGRDCVA
jgi:hypothetical protein